MRPTALRGLLLIISISLPLAGAPETFSQPPPQIKKIPSKKVIPIPIPGGQQPSPQKMKKVPSTKIDPDPIFGGQKPFPQKVKPSPSKKSLPVPLPKPQSQQ
jgi:hypothetical protein